MRDGARRPVVAGGVGLAALLAVGGGLAANAATAADRWPWPLETMRTHPWAALAVLTVAVVAAQLWLWWGAAPITTAERPLTPEARTGPPEQTPAARRSVLRNPHFTGRQTHLDGIRAALTQGRPVTATTLRGLGGVGKTHLVVEYVWRFIDDYDIIWWIDAARSELIPDQLGQLAEALGLRSADAEAACAELGRRDRWLLVFDNAERVEDVAAHLPGGQGHVLITSRTSGWGALGAVIEVDVLSRLESVTLLSRRAPDLTRDTADEISERLGDLPLALEQAAAFMERTELPARGYLDLLRGSAEAMLSRGHATGHQHTVATVWAVSAARVAREHPAASALLRLCAFLGPEPIPVDLFIGNPSALPEPLRAVAGNELTFTETAGVLIGYSLVRRRPEGLIMHRLVQAVTRHDLDAATRTAAAEAAVELLRADLPATGSSRPEEWPRWRLLLPHVLAAVSHVQTGIALVQLLSRAAVYLRLHGPRGAALPLLQRALAVDEDRFGSDHVEVAGRQQELAVVLYEVDQPATARDLLERALLVHRATHGDDHPVVASNLNMLGLTLNALGETGRAAELISRALAIDEATLGPNDWRVAHDMNNLALVLRTAGKLDRAQDLLERSLALDEARYGPDNPDIAIRLANLANVLCDRDRPAEAVPLLHRAVTIDEAAYGPEHPRVARRRAHLQAAQRQADATTRR